MPNKTPPKTRTTLGRLLQSVTWPSKPGSKRNELNQKAIVRQAKKHLTRNK